MGPALLLAALPGWAAPATIYSAVAHQSPVRADPDDLLLLAGFGFASGDKVVYRAVSNTTEPLVSPASVPATSTSSQGTADIVSIVDAPDSLTIHLPQVMTSGQSYALWVINAAGEWSNGIKINDARPLWITPDEVFASSTPASLLRVMKVVGRNLQPAAGAATQVRLVGARATFQLPASSTDKPGSAIDRYVAKIDLPAHMPVGSYDVRVSRDGVSWVPLFDQDRKEPQKLSVLPVPPTPAQFPVGSYTFGTCVPGSTTCLAVPGKCVPDATESDDQTVCIAAAIAAAHAAGGGVVKFGAGIWNMNGVGYWMPGQVLSSKGVSFDGLLVPEGVSLEGMGRTTTTLVRGTAWDIHLPSFALQGHNTVSGFTFRDAREYQNSDSGSAYFTLGARWDRAKLYPSSDSTKVSHVVITENVFDRPFYAIGNGGVSIDHLTVTDNTFGAFKTALFWEGNAANTGFQYRYSDSVVAHNKFFPGSYMDVGTRQGTIATELSGGRRIDFSDNIADGTSTQYLYHPESDPKGWRAAFFWALHDNVEMMLVSQNSAYCTGDKDGDGEAIAYDNNHNRPGFFALTAPVLDAASNLAAQTSAVTVQGSLIQTQSVYGVPINVSPVTSYYVGDWMQIVQGPGIGQARRIAAISTGSNANGQTVTFTVTPALDVLPQSNSQVTDGRLFWQTYTIGNVIDHRSPLCLKSNRTRRAGGLITLDGQTSDSAVEGNSLYDTSGISLVHGFQLADAHAGIAYPGAYVHSFDEVRGNLVDGTYDDNDRLPPAEYGIAVAFAATPDTAPPPILSYGLSVSHNTVIRAAGPKGAISLNQGWYTGPKSREFRGVTPWKIAKAALIFKNTLTDIGQAKANRVGIGLSADNRFTPIEWRSVLYGNVCRGELKPDLRLADLGTETVRYCPSAGIDSCECHGQPAHLSVTRTSAPALAEVGSAIVYTLLIANDGPGTSTGTAFSIEPPPGITINSMAGAGATCDVGDANINLCHLGSINAGASVTLTVEATVNAVGPAQTTFSVAHREADTSSRNGSISIMVRGIARH